jgi:ubiquinone/menaquinone biosynthesis C-methylase UbiE
MIDEYLAAGFPDVDSVNNREAYFACLAFLDSLPYFKDYKLKSYELLQLGQGMTVLEAGCGLGDDAFRIAERIMPGGRVTALDSSVAMIEKARSRDDSMRLPVDFQTGDVRALPFPDDSFSRCRIDRVLQHIPEPQRAVCELVRVLEPQGLILAYDNDWGTFSVTSADQETTRSLEMFWCDSFTNSWIGRDLCDLFISSGLSDVKTFPTVSIIADFETADRVYNLRETVRRAAEEGVISTDQGRCWIEELLGRTEKGSFMAALTAYTVVGRKPNK